MPDMSQWDADQPGDTPVWWTLKATMIPATVRQQFALFIGHLTAYDADKSDARRDKLVNAILDLIHALPKEQTAKVLPAREVLARVLPKGKLQQKLHSGKFQRFSGPYSNLILGLTNLITKVGGNPELINLDRERYDY